MDFNRGQNSEITSYDADGYMVGERVIVKRPGNLWFDQVSLTYGYVGDTNQPNVFERLHRIGEYNYSQYLVSKNIGSRIVTSADLTHQSGVKTMREAFSLKVPELKAIDTLHVEAYERGGMQASNGYSVWGEKSLSPRLSAGGGVANIDPDYGIWNGDQYKTGQRAFAFGKLAITKTLGVQLFYTRAFENPFAVATENRLDVALVYDFLKLFRH